MPTVNLHVFLSFNLFLVVLFCWLDTTRFEHQLFFATNELIRLIHFSNWFFPVNPFDHEIDFLLDALFRQHTLQRGRFKAPDFFGKNLYPKIAKSFPTIYPIFLVHLRLSCWIFLSQHCLRSPKNGLAADGSETIRCLDATYFLADLSTSGYKPITSIPR